MQHPGRPTPPLAAANVGLAPAIAPAELRSTLRQMRDLPTPALLAWGEPPSLFTNDAFAHASGVQVQGAAADPGWELWGALELAVRATFRDGPRVHALPAGAGMGHEAVALSPVRDDHEAVLGVLCLWIGAVPPVAAMGAMALPAAVDDPLGGIAEPVAPTAPAALTIGPASEAKPVRFQHDGPAGPVRRGTPWRWSVPPTRPEGADALPGQVLADHRPRRLTLVLSRERVWLGPAKALAAAVLRGAQRGLGRVLAEAGRREGNARFKLLADQAPLLIWMADPDGSCTYLNQFWRELTGQDVAAGRGFGWLDAVHQDDRPTVLAAFNAADRALRPFALGCRLRRADGSYGQVTVSARPRLDPGFAGFVGTGVDVSERKRPVDELQDPERQPALPRARAEVLGTGQPSAVPQPDMAAASRRLRQDLLGRLTADFAHEFNNLLTIVLGNVGLIEPVAATAAADSRHLGQVKHAALRATELTARLLAFARRRPQAAQATDVNAVALRAVDLLGAARRPLQLRPELTQPLGTAWCDPALLELILVALVTDLRELGATRGGLRLGTAAIRHARAPVLVLDPDPGRYVEVSVALADDDGSTDLVAAALGAYFPGPAATPDPGRLGLLAALRRAGGGAMVERTTAPATTVRLFLPRADPTSASAGG